jgi:cytochrome P450
MGDAVLLIPIYLVVWLAFAFFYLLAAGWRPHLRLFAMLDLSTILLLLPVALLLQVVVSYVRNPVRKIPAAHPLAPFTSLWISWIRWRKIENATLKDAHERLGPVVCLGPEEISVNCVKGGIRDVYAGGFEKRDPKSGYNWYGFFTNFGNDNMFSTGLNKPHSARKRMLSNIYSKSVVTASPVLLAQVSTILYERLLPRLAAICESADGVFEAGSLISASTMDIVTSYIFGLKASSNLLDNPEECAWFLDLYKSRHGWTFWPQEYPRLASFLKKHLGIDMSPAWVADANAEIETWTKKMCDGAAEVMQQSSMKIEETPSVYVQLSTAVRRDAKKNDVGTVNLQPVIASEVLDHLAAGFDTSAITLTYVVHELSTHKNIQARLQEELRTLSPRLVASSLSTLPDPKVVDTLPVLHAIIWETLRLHSAIPGPQPRFTPPQGCQLGPHSEYFVPGGVRVSASAGILHQNEQVYERANEWRPERWLDLDRLDEEKRKDMESRWFWAFGRLVHTITISFGDTELTVCSGGRMCVGSHLAVYRKFIILFLFSLNPQARLLHVGHRSHGITDWRSRRGLLAVITLSLPLADRLAKCLRHVGMIAPNKQERRISSNSNAVNVVVLTIGPEMKYIVAALYSSYSTAVVDDTGIEQSDAYTAPPRGKKLMIRLEELKM